MYKFLLFSLLLIFFTAGCNGGGEQNIYDLGQTIVLTLESNATTGYSWQLADPIDTKVVELISDNYLAPQTGLVGAGGVEEWTFKAIGKGKAKIKLEYVRPWEKDQAPVETQTFTLRVR